MKSSRELYIVSLCVCRYWTKDIQQMLETMVEAEGRRDSALKDTMRSLFSSFDQQ